MNSSRSLADPSVLEDLRRPRDLNDLDIEVDAVDVLDDIQRSRGSRSFKSLELQRPPISTSCKPPEVLAI